MPLWYINSMTQADIEHILIIENQSFALPWTYQLFCYELECENAFSDTVNCVIQSRENLWLNTLIAYICCRMILDEFHILRFAVAPHWRGKGVGLWFLERACRKAQMMGAAVSYLEVRSSNHPAIALYRKNGYQVIGVRKGYYTETGDDAWVFHKKL